MPAPFNLAAHVLAKGRGTPDKVALAVVSPGGADTWTYGRLIAAVLGTAAGLGERGLAAGDRVLLRLGNSADLPVAYLGAIAAGLVPVPTSAQLTRPEITAMAADLAPALTIAGPDIVLPEAPGDVLPLAALRSLYDLAPAEPVLGDPERPAYVIFTSGTSGRPRAVVHAHRAILGRGFMTAGWYGLQAQDRVMHAGAFNWTYTLGTGLMDPWTQGATALIPAPGTPAAHLPALLQRHEATIFAAAPGIFRQMLRGPVPPLPTLRHGLSAGEKLPESLRAAWREATGTEIHEAFGMSECSTFISGAPSRPAPPGTFGFAQAGRRITLRSGGAEALPGQPGTIAVHRSDPGLFLGYLNQPEETAARFDGDWFLTGDVGRMTPDGAIAYEGRADDMMNAGGYRVSPVEVEEAMEAHPRDPRGSRLRAAGEGRGQRDRPVLCRRRDRRG